MVKGTLHVKIIVNFFTYSQVPFKRGGPNKRGRAHIPVPLTRGRAHEKFLIIKRGRGKQLKLAS